MKRRDYVSALGVKRRVRALYARGYSQADIARQLEFTWTHRPKLPFMKTEQIIVRQPTHDRVDAVYRELKDTPGPNTRRPYWTPRPEWITVDEWNGYDIDDPAANPRKVSAGQYRRSPAGRAPRPTDYTPDGRLVLCRTYDNPDLWFADIGSNDYHTAMNICAQCPVRADCLEEALVNRWEHGIWGGMNERHRAAARKSLVRTAGTSDLRGTPELDAALDSFASAEAHQDSAA